MKKQQRQVIRQIIRPMGILLILLIFSTLAGCGNDGRPISSSFVIDGQSTEESTAHLEIDLSVPVLSGFDAAEAINNEINESVAAAKAEVEKAASAMEAEQSLQKAGLHTNYLYSKNGDIVSLWMMFDNYTGGAHGLYWIEPYTFNTATGERYHFNGLFREGMASASLVTDKILEEIRENPGLYFESAEETVKNYQNEFQFYINGNRVTVFFPLYDIAPYAGGIQFFDFDAEELKDILKPEIYDAIKDAKPISTKGTISEH